MDRTTGLGNQTPIGLRLSGCILGFDLLAVSNIKALLSTHLCALNSDIIRSTHMPRLIPSRGSTLAGG